MDEAGWLIELGRSPADAPDYWIGCGTPLSEPFGRWSADHMDAVRFARQVDAERVAATIPTGTRVCEHIWMGKR